MGQWRGWALCGVVGWLLAGTCAQAAVWTALEGHFANADGIAGVQTYATGGNGFADGAFSAPPTLDNAPLVARSAMGTLSFQDWGPLLPPYFAYMRAPQVDLVNLRADFSALVWLGFIEPTEPIIGFPVGIAGWVPLTDNGDGSYTAQWEVPAIIPRYSVHGSGGPISITFAASVSEPGTVWLLALTLTLAAFVRRPGGFRPTRRPVPR